MQSPYQIHSRQDLERDLQRRFFAGANWPLAAASLAALSDLGMSDHAIATYFSVQPGDVRTLRDRHGIRDAQPTSGPLRASADE